MTLEALPTGSVLLHVGPHKTGTTSLQFAAHARRAALAEAGVTYPGTQTHHSRAALALEQRTFGWANHGGVDFGQEYWDRLVHQVEAAEGTVLVSSEFFGELPADKIKLAIDGLGRDRTHVIVTLRPLTKILPSSWQQYLKGGATRRFETWLEAVLADPPDPKVTPTFWQRQDHAALVQRWAEDVGVDNLTVLVVDDQDHASLPHAFEQLLGLPTDLLAAPIEGTRSNRSLTAAECELYRRINQVIGTKAVDWPSYAQLIRNAAVVRTIESRYPAPDEPRLQLPHWAAVRASELGAQAADAIRGSGVRVIGDLDRLSPTVPPAALDDSGHEIPDPPEELPLDAAVEAMVGVVSGALGHGPYFPRERARQRASTPIKPVAGPGSVEDLVIRQATTRQLAGIVRNRARKKLKRTLGR